jgi:ABC-type uncharacterized transport system fused permease/ATPase subunit
VNSAFTWRIDNNGRVADWISSVNRVATLLLAIEEFHDAGRSADPGESRFAASKLKQVQ